MKRLLAPLAMPLLIAAMCAVSQALHWSQALRYQRDLIAAGQWWRLLSGHFVHLGWSHWLMNAAGLLLIWLLFEPWLKPRAAAGYLLCGGVLISLCLYLFSPMVLWYVGLSGVLHSLFVAGLLAQFKFQPRLAGLIGALLVAKLVWEQRMGPLPGSVETAGGPVVVVAHSYGAVAGVVCYGAGLVWRRLVLAARH